MKGVFVYETERAGIRKLGTGKVRVCPRMNVALLFLSNGKRERRHWPPLASSARMCTDLLHNAGVSIHLLNSLQSQKQWNDARNPPLSHEPHSPVPTTCFHCPALNSMSSISLRKTPFDPLKLWIGNSEQKKSFERSG